MTIYENVYGVRIMKRGKVLPQYPRERAVPPPLQEDPAADLLSQNNNLPGCRCRVVSVTLTGLYLQPFFFQVLQAPGAHGIEHREKTFAVFRQGILNPGRDFGIHDPGNYL